MSDPVVRFRRDQLAQFLPTLELIKLFENFVDAASVQTPTDLSDLWSYLYSQGSKVGRANRATERRLEDIEATPPQRANLTRIEKDIAEIKAYLGI